MSRLADHRDMTADEVVDCSYDALALIALCEAVSRDLSEIGSGNAILSGAISRALALAGELLEPVHDTLETSAHLRVRLETVKR